MKKILEAYQKNGLNLKNHIVMAPMTRCRAVNNLPNDLMAEYYRQRSGAGLIVSEGVSPSPEGLGYARIPGIFSKEQTEGWKKTTAAVHDNNGKIFVQLMHTGRAGTNTNLPEGYVVKGVSDVGVNGEIYTDTNGMQPYSTPVPYTTEEVKKVIEDYVAAAKNAIEAGFDGVELHGAHGYLLEQFLNPNVNTRTDEYGGSMENRAKAVIEVVEKTVQAIGAEKVGIRISPFSPFNDMTAYDAEEVHQTYEYLAREFNRIGIAYIHLSANPSITEKTYKAIRSAFSNTIILCNGLTPETAEEKLHEGFADLVGFGRSFIANPDLADRIRNQSVLAEPDMKTFYTPGAEGLIDYPVLDAQTSI